MGGWQWAGLWDRDKELTKLWVSGQGLPLSPLHFPALSAAPTHPSMASCPRPGSASDTTSTPHSEVWSGELRSPFPHTKRLQWQVSSCHPQNSVIGKSSLSPWPDLAWVVQGPMSPGPFPGPPGRCGSSWAWVVLGSPCPSFWELQDSDSH